MAVNSKENLLGMLRQRTEEEELKQYLKTTVGGYTKSSVMEYLSELRQRQQSSSETFNENMQSLLEEKENLKTENEKLLMQIAQAKADFLRLAEAKKQQEKLKADTVNDNIVYLKSSIPASETSSMNPQTVINALENKTETQKYEISEKEINLENEIEALKNEISDKVSELENSRQEIIKQNELLALERLEAKKQRERISELSAVSQALGEELCCLKEKYSEDTLEKLNEQIADLTASVEQQDEMILHLKNQTADKDNKIKTLLDENVTMMKSLELMSNSLDVMSIQNEKLLTANNALAQAFEDESKKVVKLINDISEETVEKLILERKLEETISHLSLAENSTCQSDKNEKPKEADSQSSIA
ncbi:hypothetical protein AAFA46_08515 [Oscillospiraceae bacterium WX1]